MIKLSGQIIELTVVVIMWDIIWKIFKKYFIIQWGYLNYVADYELNISFNKLGKKDTIY